MVFDFAHTAAGCNKKIAKQATAHVRKTRLRLERIGCDRADSVVPNILMSVALRLLTGRKSRFSAVGITQRL